MKPGVLVFSVVAVAAWLVLAWVTWQAGTQSGWAAVSDAFNEGLTQPWPAQFQVDLMINLFLFAPWIAWRSSSRIAGLAGAVAVLFLGSLFSIPYILLALRRSGGDVAAALLGRHYRTS